MNAVYSLDGMGVDLDAIITTSNDPIATVTWGITLHELSVANRDDAPTRTPASTITATRRDVGQA
jgi:hypothetical protein